MVHSANYSTPNSWPFILARPGTFRKTHQQTAPVHLTLAPNCNPHTNQPYHVPQTQHAREQRHRLLGLRPPRAQRWSSPVPTRLANTRIQLRIIPQPSELLPTQSRQVIPDLRSVRIPALNPACPIVTLYPHSQTVLLAPSALSTASTVFTPTTQSMLQLYLSQQSHILSNILIDTAGTGLIIPSNDRPIRTIS